MGVVDGARCGERFQDIVPGGLLYQYDQPRGEVELFETALAQELSKLHSGLTDENIPKYAARVVASLPILGQLDLDHMARLVARLPEEPKFAVNDGGIVKF